MASRNQARINFRKRIAAADIRITDLAKRIGHDISVVSKAINHGRFPRVRAKIEEVLR